MLIGGIIVAGKFSSKVTLYLTIFLIFSVDPINDCDMVGHVVSLLDAFTACISSLLFLVRANWLFFDSKKARIVLAICSS